MLTFTHILEICHWTIEWAERAHARGEPEVWPRRLDVASNATLEQVQAAMPGWTVRLAPPRSTLEAKYWPGVFLIWPPWASP
jgi:hypothetical protein